MRPLPFFVSRYNRVQKSVACRLRHSRSLLGGVYACRAAARFREYIAKNWSDVLNSTFPEEKPKHQHVDQIQCSLLLLSEGRPFTAEPHHVCVHGTHTPGGAEGTTDEQHEWTEDWDTLEVCSGTFQVADALIQLSGLLVELTPEFDFLSELSLLEGNFQLKFLLRRDIRRPVLRDKVFCLLEKTPADDIRQRVEYSCHIRLRPPRAIIGTSIT